MKNYRNFRSFDLSIITAFLAVGVVAVIACEEDPAYVPNSCHWQEKAVDSLDDYLNAEDEPSTEKAIKTTAVYLSLAVNAKKREERDGFELVCEKTTETLEESIRKMGEPTHLIQQ